MYSAVATDEVFSPSRIRAVLHASRDHLVGPLTLEDVVGLATVCLTTEAFPAATLLRHAGECDLHSLRAVLGADLELAKEAGFLPSVVVVHSVDPLTYAFHRYCRWWNRAVFPALYELMTHERQRGNARHGELVEQLREFFAAREAGPVASRNRARAVSWIHEVLCEPKGALKGPEERAQLVDTWLPVALQEELAALVKFDDQGHVRLSTSGFGRVVREYVGLAERGDKEHLTEEQGHPPSPEPTAEELLAVRELQDLRDDLTTYPPLGQVVDAVLGGPGGDSLSFVADELVRLRDMLRSIGSRERRAGLVFEYLRRGRPGGHGSHSREEIAQLYGTSAKQLEHRAADARDLIRRVLA